MLVPFPSKLRYLREAGNRDRNWNWKMKKMIKAKRYLFTIS